jgi:GH25 family lysozyme M1 (1,4-beta-N-acetylmuramidase)
MNNICALKTMIPGYDVSHYQPNLNIHAQMKAAGKKFCIIKCIEGVNINDRLFAAHWKEAKNQGMIVGAYNFFHPSQDPVAQAQHFAAIAGPLGAGTLGPVSDWETADGVPAVTDAAEGLSYLQSVSTATGRDGILYGGPYFLQALALNSKFLKYALWVAHYGAKCPLVPPPYQTWTFWQYTSAGGLDLNFFNGSMDQLKKMAQMV